MVVELTVMNECKSILVPSRWNKHTLFSLNATKKPGQNAWSSYLRTLKMVAVGFREETKIRSTTNPAVSFLVLFPLGSLSLDSRAVQTQNCTVSADRNGSKRSLLFFLSKKQ